MRGSPGRLAAVALVILLAAAACGGGSGGEGEATQDGGGALNGLFRITAGACTDDGVTGSYFRMIQSGGKVGDGPFVANGDSACEDKTWSPLRAGADGGLQTGAFQAGPAAAFDDKGNGTATAIVQPTKWFAVAFAAATNETDPQTKATTKAPSISASDGELTGDLNAFAAAWNGQHFNQGSPKPDGSRPGNTTPVSGTYDEGTKEYTLQWTSQIVGGPFNNFTGVWHLEGTFEPA
jgi:hypothetical protein